ncbi:WD40-repeat-containing domain protein [Mycena crocata]|nr:WD40-repeat-containing domain protein [Mycena crocata]
MSEHPVGKPLFDDRHARQISPPSPTMSSLKPSLLTAANPPWGSWSLDYQFLSDLNSWTANNPANNTLRTVLQSVSEAIEGSRSYVGLIPNSPFPAQTLVTALGTLIQFGAKVTLAKQEVRKFAHDTVEWITRIADAFREGEVGRLVARSWNDLQSMRILIDEICAWAAKRLADGRWKRFLRGATVDHEIRQFKEDLAKTTECFRTLSTIHLAQGQDLVLRDTSIIQSLIKGLKRENEANREIISNLISAQEEARRVKEMREQAEARAQRELEKNAQAEQRAREQAERHRRELDDAFGPIIAENSTSAAQSKEFCYGSTRAQILEEIRAWVFDLAEPSPRFLWLTGMPGSGKSVITATVAKMFAGEGMLAAQFFISRTQAYEPTTNPNTLFPTIAKQLYAFHADALSPISKAVKSQRSIILQISDSQANGLFITPLTAICKSDPTRPVIVVIDALDEWNTNSQREVKPIDILLRAVHQLPCNAKVVLSSRHEDPIITPFTRFNPFHINLVTSSPASLRDVENYIRDKLDDIVSEFGEDWAGWPTKNQVQRLCNQAAGHFIWAATATKFIRYRIKADGTECQDEVLDDLQLRGGLNGLYSAILTRYLPDTEASWSFDRFRRIVGAVIVLRSPLNIAALGDLLDLKKTPQGRRVDINHFFKMFQSVLSAGPEVITSQSVPRLHGSFVEFITGDASKQFQVDEAASNEELAARCMALLKDLYFNISDIPSSHFIVEPRGELPALPTALSYACHFWADHLTAMDPTTVQGILSEVQITLESRFLYWLEVMSVTGRLAGALTILRKVATRIPDMPLKLKDLLREASQFIIAFHEPISRSAPHIYISALPFLRADSQIYQAFAPLFPSTLKCSSLVNRRIHPLLRFNTPDKVTCMAFSNDSMHIATASATGKLQVWDSRTGEALTGVLKAHKGSITCASFSPMTGRIATGGEDHTLSVMDINTGKVVVKPWEAHARLITAITYSPDGNHLISAGVDGKIKIWEAETGKAVGKPLKGQSGDWISLAFSPGSIHFASCNEKEIIMWKLSSPKGAKLRHRIPSPKREASFTALSFSGDGSHIFAGVNGEIWAWELVGTLAYRSLKCHILPDGNVDSITFDQRGRCMVSSSYRGAIVVWDPLSGEIITGPLEGHSIGLDFAVFSPDGQYIASANSNRVVRVWDLAEKLVADSTLVDQIAKVQCVALSPNRIHVASGGDDALIKIWDCRESGRAALHELDGHVGAIDSVAFSNDGDRLISCARQDSAIRVWNVEDGRLACAPFKIDGYPLAVGFLPSVAGDPIVRFHYVQSSFTQRGQELDSIKPGSARLPEDGDYCNHRMPGDDDSSMSDSSLSPQKQFWKTISKAEKYPMSRRTTTYLSANGSAIVSCSDKRTIQLTTGSENTRARTLQWPAQGVTSVAVAPDGQHLVWGSDSNIFVWNIAERALLSNVLLGHTDEMTALAFSPDGRQIVSAALDRTIRVRKWSVEAHQQNGEYRANFAFSSNPAHSFPIHDPLYGRGIRTAEPYRCCSIDEHGWMKGEGGELLFWVPPENRAGLWMPDTLAIIAAQPTALDLSHFVHGDSWTKCYQAGGN